MSDPHNWNSWDNYRAVHEQRMQSHPFVRENHLEWDLIGDPKHPDAIFLTGTVICYRDVIVTVNKTIETRVVGPHRFEVRGLYYAYNAHFVGRHNILRYDNGHIETPDEFHRHQFDLTTGEQISVEIIPKSRVPVLGAFFTEVAAIVGFDPQTDE